MAAALPVMAPRLLRQPGQNQLAETPIAGGRDRDDEPLVHKVRVIGQRPADAGSGVRLATADLENFRRLSREHAEIGPVVALYAEYQAAERDLAAAQEMLADSRLRAKIFSDLARKLLAKLTFEKR